MQHAKDKWQPSQHHITVYNHVELLGSNLNNSSTSFYFHCKFLPLPWVFNFCCKLFFFAMSFSFLQQAILFVVRFPFLLWAFLFWQEVFYFAVSFSHYCGTCGPPQQLDTDHFLGYGKHWITGLFNLLALYRLYKMTVAFRAWFCYMYNANHQRNLQDPVRFGLIFGLEKTSDIR